MTTTYVLGAGASFHAGFPLAGRFREAMEYMAASKGVTIFMFRPGLLWETNRCAADSTGWIVPSWRSGCTIWGCRNF